MKKIFLLVYLLILMGCHDSYYITSDNNSFMYLKLDKNDEIKNGEEGLDGFGSASEEVKNLEGSQRTNSLTIGELKTVKSKED